VDAIRAEALALIADDGSARAAADIEPGSDPRAALWRAIALMRRGERIEDACARCPETVALLGRLPLFRVAGESPECCFALLPPGADRTMAAGASNACLVVQLTLEAEGDCGIRIGDTTVAWQRGRALAFDDTRASQQWNRSDAPVVALLFNIWNPHLDADERDALGRLIPAITHLQRSGQDGP
jgi:aspartate beta-hydroxylase